jgi:hypothetical protein
MDVSGSASIFPLQEEAQAFTHGLGIDKIADTTQRERITPP